MLLVVLEQEPRKRRAFGAPARVSNRHAVDEIRPAIPRFLLHDAQKVGGVAHRAAPTVVRPLVHSQQSTIGQKADTVRIAQSPGNELELGTVRTASHDSCSAWQTGRDALIWLGCRSEGTESTGRCPRPVPRDGGGCIEADPCQAA